MFLYKWLIQQAPKPQIICSAALSCHVYLTFNAASHISEHSAERFQRKGSVWQRLYKTLLSRYLKHLVLFETKFLLRYAFSLLW